MSDKKDIAGQLRVWAHDAALQDALDHCRGLNEAAREIERLRDELAAMTDKFNRLKDAFWTTDEMTEASNG